MDPVFGPRSLDPASECFFASLGLQLISELLEAGGSATIRGRDFIILARSDSVLLIDRNGALHPPDEVLDAWDWTGRRYRCVRFGPLVADVEVTPGLHLSVHTVAAAIALLDQVQLGWLQ